MWNILEEYPSNSWLPFPVWPLPFNSSITVSAQGKSEDRKLKRGRASKQWVTIDEVQALAMFTTVLINPGDWKRERKDLSAVGFVFSAGKNDAHRCVCTDFPQQPPPPSGILLREVTGTIQPHGVSRIKQHSFHSSWCTDKFKYDWESGGGCAPPVGVALGLPMRTNVSRQWLWPPSGCHSADIKDANLYAGKKSSCTTCSALRHPVYWLNRYILVWVLRRLIFQYVYVMASSLFITSPF